jgi:L-threonylcarbamoyladenylate synthase
LVGLVDLTQLSPLAGARVEALTDAFWPGPLTLVLPKLPVVPDLATAGLATVAVRAPLHPIARALLHELGEPLAAPSANRFGRISPTTVDDVASELADRIDWALDGGPCSVGVESTVVAVANDGRLTLLRPGGVPAAELAAVVGLELGRTQASEGAQVAPGMLASHYAPRTPVVLLPAAVSGRVAVLGWQRLPQLHGAEVIAGDVLSAVGDPAEAARRLFRALRTLDASGAEVIAVELPPTEEGLCHAIRDRLQRAAAPR